MYPAGFRFLPAAQAEVAVATGPAELHLPSFAFDAAVPVVHRTALAADRGLLDVLKAHSKVPLDARAVVARLSNAETEDAGECAFFDAGDVLWRVLTSASSTRAGGAGTVEQTLEPLRMALELGGDPRGVFIKLADDAEGSINAHPIVFTLAWAQELGSPDEAEAILRLLVEAGADLNAVNSAGHTFVSSLILCDMSAGGPNSNVNQARLANVTRLIPTAIRLGADVILPDAAPLPPYTPATWAKHDVTSTGDLATLNAAQLQRPIQLLQAFKDGGADIRPETHTVVLPLKRKPTLMPMPAAEMACQPGRQDSSVGSAVVDGSTEAGGAETPAAAGASATATVTGHVNVADNHLIKAIRMDYKGLMEWILANTGCDVNFRLDNISPSYLFTCARHAAVESLPQLLAAGADLTRTDATGHTASQIARWLSEENNQRDDEVGRINGPMYLQVATVLEQAEAEWAALSEGSAKATGGPA